MALPTLSKTWRFRVNQVLSAGSGIPQEEMMMALINSLLGGGSWTDSAGAVAAVSNPWTVVSSNGRLTGPTVGVNVLTSTSELVWATTGNRWWIILQRVDGVQLCISMPYSSSEFAVGMKFSVSGAFSGGTATVVPSAADETNWATSATWCNQTTSSDHILHVLHSTDGLETRILINCNSVASSSFILGDLRNPGSAVTDPFYFGGVASSTVNHPVTGTGGLMSGDTSPMWMRHNSLNVRLNFLMEACTKAGAYFSASSITAANDFDTVPEWPFYEMSITGVTTTGGFGRAGLPYDLWVGNWSPRTNGDQYPASGTLRQFAQHGYMIHPWNTTVMRVA